MFKKIWQYLNGKKLIIADFYWGTSGALLLIWFPDGLPSTPNKIYLSIGLLFTFIGLGHKAIKKMRPKNEN